MTLFRVNKHDSKVLIDLIHSQNGKNGVLRWSRTALLLVQRTTGGSKFDQELYCSQEYLGNPQVQHAKPPPPHPPADMLTGNCWMRPSSRQMYNSTHMSSCKCDQ